MELTGDPTTVTGAATHTLRLLARRITHLTDEIEDLDERLAETLDAHAPALLERRGVGPDTAAALLTTAGDNPERLESQASFARIVRRQPGRVLLGQGSRDAGSTAAATAKPTALPCTALRCRAPRWDSRTQ